MVLEDSSRCMSDPAGLPKMRGSSLHVLYYKSIGCRILAVRCLLIQVRAHMRKTSKADLRIMMMVNMQFGEAGVGGERW